MQKGNTKVYQIVSFAAVLLSMTWCGCAHLSPSPAGAVTVKSEDATQLAVRNNAASLLRDLLDDEQNVGKVFIVKGGKTVEPLVKLIGTTATTQLQTLDHLTNADPGLNLHVSDLPPGEQAARDAEAKTKEHELLLSAGPHFEFNLLLTQAEALNYGWHLSRVAAKNAPDNEAKTFDNIGDELRRLYEQTVTEMRSLPSH